MKEIVKVMLAEGLDEDTIHEVLNVLEKWGERTGISNYDTPNKKSNTETKVSYMSPDQYLQKATNTFRRVGFNDTKNSTEKEISSHREAIERYKKDIQDPEVKVNLPSIGYRSSKLEQDYQEGRHRAVAAKELGHKTIPVVIAYEKGKRTPVERRQYQIEKKEAKRVAKERRSTSKQVTPETPKVNNIKKEEGNSNRRKVDSKGVDDIMKILYGDSSSNK